MLGMLRVPKNISVTSDSAPSKDVLGYFLIILSSVLLGIWAVKGTIALRNILLGIETLLSILYCYRFFKANNQKIPLKNWTPLIFLGLMFCWVIFHYFFLSRFPEQQLHELTSTWFRSGLAVIVGVGTGLAITQRHNAINCLWLGILGSFAYLFYQYIPNALALKSLFAPDYINYIFYGKISGVLAGTILVVGLLGTMADAIRRGQFWDIFGTAILWLLGTATALYAYVFIFDARNGVGLAAIFFTLMIITSIFQLIKSLLTRKVGLSPPLLLALMIVSTVMLGWFGIQHIKHNPGWSTMWEDTKTSIQIEKYPNWQNPAVMGYPQNPNGEVVKANTYERLAWASAGARIFLPENPLGVGILSKPFTTLLMQKYPNGGAYIPSTHSAWVEIALAFGCPGLLLILGALVSIPCISVSFAGPHQYLTSLLSLGLILLYTVGEVSSQHAIEMLCFLIALMSALLPSSE
jgi:hypothetical protein